MRCFLISTLLLCASTQIARADRKIGGAALVELERGEARPHLLLHLLELGHIVHRDLPYPSG